MPGISSTSTRRAAASTAVAGQATVINSGTGFTVTGTVVTGNTTINLGVVTPGQTSAASQVTASGGPTIANIQYLDANNNVVSGQIAVNTVGGNILINGSSFVANSRVYINNTLATNTFISSSQIRATVPSGNVGNVSLLVFTPTNSGFFGPDIRYSGAPSWATTAISGNNGSSVSIQLVATGDSALTYTLGAGSLPTGLSLSSSGLITGTITGYTVNTVVSFTVIATDQEGQQSSQVINFTVSVGDAFWSYVPLLLSASTPAAQTWITDASINDFAVTVAGDTRPTNRTPFASNPGTYGSAYFDGTGDAITVPTAPPLVFGTSDFTIEYWMYPISNGTTSRMFGNGAGGSWTTGKYAIWPYNASGKLAVDVFNYSSSAPMLISTTTMAPNLWYHVAITRSGSTWRLFINGTQEATVTSSITFDSAANLSIGSSGFNEFYNGFISNLRLVNGTAVYTANFTPSTVPLTAIANTSLLILQTNQPAANNQFLDSSTANNLLTRSGNATQGTFSPFGENWSNYFDGTGDYLTTPTSAALSLGTGDFTVEMWVNSQDVTVQSQRGFFQISDTIGGLKTTYTTGITCYFAGAGTGSINTNVGGTDYGSAVGLVQPNNWYHVAVTRASGTVRLWLNGTQVATGTNNTANLTGTYAAIGGYYSTAFLMLGYVSNLRVVKGTAIYTASFTPSTTPLAAVSGTSLLTCQSPYLIDNSVNRLSITRNGDVSVQEFSPFTGTTLPTPAYGVFFDGTGDSYNVTTNQSAFDFGTGDFTIEFWTYLFANGDYGFFYDSRPSATTSNSLSIFHQSPGQLAIQYQNNAFLGSATNALPTNTWLHVAVTRASGSTRIFINGTQSGSTASESNNYINNANRPIIGTDKDSQFFINGYMSNFRVVKGTALYTSNFTPSTTPLTAVSGTSLLVQTNRLTDSSSLNNTLAVSGDTRPVTWNPFTPQYSTNQSYSTSVIGGSMYFDGTGDLVSGTTGGSLGASNFTIEAWVYATSWTTFGPIVENTNTGRYQLGFTGTNALVFFSGSAIATTASNTAPLNTWLHVAVVRNGSATNNISIYINGTRQAQGTSTTNFSDDGLRVGLSFDNFGIRGWISNLRILKGTALYTSNFVPQNTPLTPVTNTTLLLPGTGAAILDSAVQNVFETAADAKILSDANTPGTPYLGSYYSNYFDGTGDYLSITSGTTNTLPSGNDSYTIEAWIYATTTTGNRGIIGWGSYGTNNAVNALKIDAVGAVITNYWWGSGISTGSLSGLYNQWHHIAATYDGTTRRIFYDGVQVASDVPGVTNNVTTTNNLTVGMTFNGNEYFTGYISNARVIKGTALYTGNFTPSTTPLTAVSGTSLLTCQSSRFVDNSTNNFAITRNGNTAVRTYNPWQNNLLGSVYFDGTGDYIITPYKPNMGISGTNWTIEMWVCPTVLVGGNYACLMAVGGTTYNWAAGTGYQYFMQLDPSGNVYFQYYVSNGVNANLTSNIALTVGAWNHVAVTYSGTTLRVFVNGTLAGSATVTLARNTGMTTLALGGAGPVSNSNYLTGYMSDVRITSGIARYTANFTPPTSALLTQ